MMLRAVALTHAHMECRRLEESLPVLMELLGFQRVADAPGEVTLKHPNTEWLLIVHEARAEAPAKRMHNHFGVRVATRREVDAAYDYLNGQKEKYRLKQIGKPLYNHGSYSLYFLEPGTNGWEIECYEDVLRKDHGWQRQGGVYAPHWDTPMPEERFPGRGYVPQAFTHGTLASADSEISRNFYANVLGLEVHPLNERVVYVKHPATTCYIVSAYRDQFKTFSSNFRFTLALGSQGAVTEAHRSLTEEGERVGVRRLGELKANGATANFLLWDPDGNCWEISSLNGSQ